MLSPLLCSGKFFLFFFFPYFPKAFEDKDLPSYTSFLFYGKFKRTTREFFKIKHRYARCAERAKLLEGKLKQIFWDEDNRVFVDSRGTQVNVSPVGYPDDLKDLLYNLDRPPIDTIRSHAAMLGADAFCRTPLEWGRTAFQFYKQIE